MTKRFSPTMCLDHAAQYIGFLPAMLNPDGTPDRKSIREAQFIVLNAERTIRKERRLAREHTVALKHIHECQQCRQRLGLKNV